jgi:hypothetical protein
MDYADQNHATDRWPNGAPPPDAGSPPDDEATSASGVDPGVASDADGRDLGDRRASVTHGFLVELAKAMHAAADQERGRMESVVADEGAAHVERARARASVEAEEFRRIADEDLDLISEWSASEIERIHSEAARRAEERRSALDEYIAQHEAIIDTEIQGVDSALAQYRITLEQFFSELTASTDPAEIARRAGTLPPPPDLDEVRANARAAAVGRLAQETAPDGGADNDQDPSTAEATLEEAAESTQATHQPPTDDADFAESPEIGAPLVGVMDPEAARQTGPPDVLMPVHAGVEDASEAAVEDASLDAARADVTEDEREPMRVAAGLSTEPNSAVRLLRSIAPWTTPSDHIERQVVDEADEHQGPDKAI